MKNKILRSFLAVVFLVVVLCSRAVTAFADTQIIEEDVTEPYIVVDSYKISNDCLVLGESFTLTLYLKNPSTTKTAREVLIDITNPAGVVPVYGTVSQLFLGDIAPRETVEVSFDYDSWSVNKEKALEFSITLVSNTKINYVSLRVPIGTDEVFSIINSSMAKENYVGLSTSASVSFRVLGEESLGNVELRVENNGETIGKSLVGSITAGITKTQSVSFVLDQPGEYALDFYLDYELEGGKTETEFVGSKTLSVKEAVPNNNVGNAAQVVTQLTNDGGSAMLLLGGLLILAIFVVAVVIIKKKR